MGLGCPFMRVIVPLFFLVSAVLADPRMDFLNPRRLFAFQARHRLHTMAFGASAKSSNAGYLWVSRGRGPASLTAPPDAIPALFSRGGARAATSSVMPATATPTARFTISGLWGVLGVLAILGNALRRLIPIAMEPFKAGGFTPALWAAYAGFSLVMAYAEGYKGFQLKFSPLVVKRSMTLGANSPFLHKLFAPFYSMGLFHSTRKRKIVSYSLAVGIFGLIRLVKSLAYPWRSIIDAGVVVGLSWGATSIAVIYAASLFGGKVPDIDPALPEKEA